MKVPGVGSVVATVTGGAGAVQLLASPVVELAGPVMQSVAQSTGRALGMNSSANGSSPDGITPPVRWQSGQRVHLDLDPLLPFPSWHEHAPAVEEPVRRIAGVATAHVEGALGRLVVEIESDADSDIV